MKVPGYAIERCCSFFSLGPCDFEGVVAIVFDCDGKYIGQACDQHLKHAMFVTQRDAEEVKS